VEEVVVVDGKDHVCEEDVVTGIEADPDV